MYQTELEKAKAQIESLLQTALEMLGHDSRFSEKYIPASNPHSKSHRNHNTKQKGKYA